MASNLETKFRAFLDENEKNLTMGFMVVVCLAVVAFFIYTSASQVGGSYSQGVMSLDLMLMLSVFAVSIPVTYVMVKSLEFERNIQFYDGEEVILESKSSGTFVAILSMGDQDVPLEPIHCNTYLTTMGISAEPKGSGEIALFIPRDTIRDFGAHRKGIAVRFMDINGMFKEALLMVDNRNAWLSELARVTQSNL